MNGTDCTNSVNIKIFKAKFQQEINITNILETFLQTIQI